MNNVRCTHKGKVEWMDDDVDGWEERKTKTSERRKNRKHCRK